MKTRLAAPANGQPLARATAPHLSHRLARLGLPFEPTVPAGATVPYKAQADTLKIVALGGGTGLSTLLHGLKGYTGGEAEPCALEKSASLTAIVTVTDDGGSSGRLRRDFDILAPGDIRNCMVALAEDEALLARLFQYRFNGGSGLDGHSFGNLFLAALTNVTGDFHQAIQFSSEVLAIRGRIYPSTLANVQLEADMDSGSAVTGESKITRSPEGVRSIRLLPEHCEPLPETLEAIEEADLITLGPGSLYTSVIPNLLVDGVADAIADSAATVVCVGNIMEQPGETERHTAARHVEAIHDHAGRELVDAIVVNTKPISDAMRERYSEQSADPVELDLDNLSTLGVNVIADELLGEGPKVRHDSCRLASILMGLAADSRERRQSGSERAAEA